MTELIEIEKHCPHCDQNHVYWVNKAHRGRVVVGRCETSYRQALNEAMSDITIRTFEFVVPLED